jgi:glycine cleavage system H protein
MTGPSQPLTFMMGEFEASFPTDRQYATNHMWAAPLAEQRYRFGLTAYAVRLLQDVYFLDWTLDAPAALSARQQIGAIESKKAESDLFAPCDGHLLEINESALDDPSVINADPYGDGWLLEIDVASHTNLLNPDAYLDHLEGAWKVAERTIKGQIR